MKFQYQEKETIVTVICDDSFDSLAKKAIGEAREIIESKIDSDPFFGITYDPYLPQDSDDSLIRRMCSASVLANVGPMAGVAGAVAVYTVEKLKEAGSKVAVVENGGDLAIFSERPVPVGLYAAHPILKDIAFKVKSDGITGVCSSSAKIGPSVSFGNSDVCTVFSDDVILADCCATALGNLVKSEELLAPSVECIGSISGVKGCFACCGGKVAVFGDIPEMIPADCSALVPSKGE